MPSTNLSNKRGILHALLPGARVDKNTKKILVHVGTSNETVTFNVGGTVFETYKSTLTAVPNSRLGNDAFLAKHFRPDKNDHFFDRDPEIFHCVLNYHRTGELHLPTSVCGPVVKSELEYWGVDEVDIEECCWSRYSTWASTLKALRKLEDDRKSAVQLGHYPHKDNSSPGREFCRKAWQFFSDPTSSTAAQIYAYISITVIMLSIFSFCAQTHDFFKVEESSIEQQSNFNNTSTLATTTATAKDAAVSPQLLSPPNKLPGGATSAEPDSSPSPEPTQSKPRQVVHPALFYLDIICLIFFIVELTLRFLVSPRKCRFLLLPMTLIEILALIPDLVDLSARLFTSSYEDYKEAANVLSFLKVFRVFRIFRLMRHVPGLWILFYTLKASIKDLLLLLLFVGVGMLVFSSLVYFAEHGQQESFSSIPKCFWWAVITMTTVGYGDMYPETNWGYLVGTATGISGVLMIGFTVPVLVNNFIMYYNHTTSTINREKHRKRARATSICRGMNGTGSAFGGFGGVGFGERFMGMGTFDMGSGDKDANGNEKVREKDDVRKHDDEDAAAHGSLMSNDGDGKITTKVFSTDTNQKIYSETTFL